MGSHPMIMPKRRYVYEDLDRWGNVRVSYGAAEGKGSSAAPRSLARKLSTGSITTG